MNNNDIRNIMEAFARDGIDAVKFMVVIVTMPLWILPLMAYITWEDR